MKKYHTKEVVFTLQAYTAPVVVQPVLHWHDIVQLGFYEKGPVTFQFGSASHQLTGDECVLCWGRVPHAAQDSPPGNHCRWLTVPTDLFVTWDLPKSITTAVLMGELLKIHSPEFRAFFQCVFSQLARELSFDPILYKDVVVITFESLYKRFCIEFSHGDSGQSVHSYENKTVFMKMYQYICEHYKENIRVIDVAKHANVHENYAIRLFKKNCGYTINNIITHMRIHEAQRMLVSSNMSVMEIAFESGFGTVSNFYAAFNKFCSLTPKEYRLAFFGDKEH